MHVNARKLQLLACLVLPVMCAHAQSAASTSLQTTAGQRMTIVKAYGQLPLTFEENRGQIDAPVKFLSYGPGYRLLLTPTEAVLSAQSPGSSLHRPALLPAGSDPTKNSSQATVPPKTSPPVVLRMKLLDANQRTIVSGQEELPGKSHYFIGNDPSKWCTNVRQFAKVLYQGVYPGVDLVYYSHQQELEYDFILKPGADPRRILLAIKGADGLRLEHGDIVLTTSSGDAHLRSPRVYQEEKGKRHEVGGRYVLRSKNELGFVIGPYDRSKELVIDPVLAYSTYVDQDEGAYGMALDPAGIAYVAGLTGLNGRDVVVTKLNADGSSVLYKTYLGGTLDESIPAIAVDSAGNAYVTGSTQSTDFPIKNALQPINQGYYDAFITKISRDGSTLTYSTYLGGSAGDFGSSIAVDTVGNAYVVGVTGSTDFPTANALQSSASGQGDAFVAKINAAGSAFVYSTYLTGSSGAYASAVAADSKGNAYVTGATESSDFPTVHALQPYKGGRDAFLSKINSRGSGFVYSTFLGGSGEEDMGAITLDSAANVSLVGSTTSTDFPTVNPIQAINAGGWDVFVTKIDAAGGALVYSTYLGGSDRDNAYSALVGGGGSMGIAVDKAGNTFVTGYTSSSDFPVLNTIQRTFGGRTDAFVTGINSAGSALIFSTYFGGSGLDYGAGLGVDSHGSAYVAGSTASSTLPTTSAASDRSYRGAFLIKLAPNTFVSGLPAKAAFGTQLMGTTAAPKNFIFRNNAATTLAIDKIYFMGANASDFNQTNTCGSAVAAGAKCTIALSFSPSALNQRRAVLVISDSDSASPQAVALSGFGTVVSFSPTKLSFGSQSLGTVASKSMTLTNTGQVVLKITSISVTGAAAGDFSQTNNCTAGVPANGHCTITVTFKPTVSGTRNAGVTVKDSGGGSPQGVHLTGTGV